MPNRKGRHPGRAQTAGYLAFAVLTQRPLGPWGLVVGLSGVSHSANANQSWFCRLSVLLSPQVSADPGGSNLVPSGNLGGTEVRQG